MPPRSLNYSIKKKEAERIDSENQKIMSRIVNSGPFLSAKKMEKDYKEALKFKNKTMTLNLEKILEKKKKYVRDA